jgi:peptidoglycan/xylan/chitin deacetylase (PgdA/CDA1 family)
MTVRGRSADASTLPVKVCISIDLDNYQDYQSLLDTDLDGEPPSLYEDAIPRFLDIFDRNGVTATFFVIGRDAARADNRRIVREIAERGHEVGNHSFTHPYNFRQLGRAQKVAEIEQAEAAIGDTLGERPVGFRTPSCDVDLDTLELLGERGYLYDSSIFATPLMWAFMLYGRLFVRRAEYQLGHLSSVFAPARPYLPRADKLHRPRRSGDAPGPRVVEIPVSVTRWLRLPLYSTFVRLLGTRFFDRCLRAPRHEAELHMLFHMIEMADFDGTALADAVGNSPGIGIPLERRVSFVSHAMEALSRHGICVPMRELAQEHLEQRGIVEAA